MSLYRVLGLAFGLGLMAVMLNARAEVVANMYEATVPVKSQERPDRDDAIRLAFTEVLVRVSGRTSIADSDDYPRIRAALVNATNYAQQFRFRDKGQQKYVTAGEASLELWVKFDPVVVNKLLRDSNVPVWDRTRPATLVWLVTDERARRDILSQASSGLVRNAVDERSRARGVPLILPQMDITDRNTLQINEAWSNKEEALRRAAQRYPSDAMLVGRLLLLPSGQWNANWTLYHEGRKLDWAATNAPLATAVNLGIDNTAESLAQRYAQLVQGDESVVFLQINGVRTLNDFNQAQKYLRSLSQVKSVNPQLVQSDAVIFRINTTAGRLGLARAISLSQVLSAETGANGTAGQSGNLVAELVYRLVP